MVNFEQIFDIPLLDNPFISFLNLFFLTKLNNIHSKHQLKEHRCELKKDIKWPTQIRAEQRIMVPRISLHELNEP